MYFLLSIMTVHMCAYYICIIVLCITCVGHVSLSMCIFLYIKSLVLCYKISVVCYVQCILASLSSLKEIEFSIISAFKSQVNPGR